MRANFAARALREQELGYCTVDQESDNKQHSLPRSSRRCVGVADGVGIKFDERDW